MKYLTYTFLVVLTLIIIIVPNYYRALERVEYNEKLKAQQEANAILEEKLDSYRMSEAECKAVLVHTVNEGVRLTELIVKNNKGKK